MNRIVIFLLMLCLYSSIYAQYSNSDLRKVDGLSLGLEKNNSVWLDYGFKRGFHIHVKHSAIADKLPRQSWQIGASYNYWRKDIGFCLSPFLTSDWYVSFVNWGCSFKLSSFWKKEVIKVGIEYLPYFDSDLKFQNAWAVAAQTLLHKNISLFAEYGRKPDYRIAYKRAYLGFEMKAAELYVKPMLEIPIYDSGIRFDHSKIVVSLFYNFAG